MLPSILCIWEINMNLNLHANATTTPKTRRYIQKSELSNTRLAQELNVSVDTVLRWKERDDVHDRSHTPHNLQTTLTETQEKIVVELRRYLLLPLDDMLVITREFINPNVSRSGLDRCLRRHGVSRLSDLIPASEKDKKPTKTFKDYEPGFVHVDIKYLPQMPDESTHGYLFVGIDRASRWVYMDIMRDKSANSAAAFLQTLHDKAPFKIQKLLTDNGKEFTDRFVATGEREPTGNHLFDKTCNRLKIEHRLISPGHPQTNGMVERFNGRISDVLKNTRFSSSHDLKQTMGRYNHLYNHQIPQRSLLHKTPIDTLKEWQKKRPNLFKKQVRNHPGPDRYEKDASHE